MRRQDPRSQWGRRLSSAGRGAGPVVPTIVGMPRVQRKDRLLLAVSADPERVDTAAMAVPCRDEPDDMRVLWRPDPGGPTLRHCQQGQDVDVLLLLQLLRCRMGSRQVGLSEPRWCGVRTVGPLGASAELYRWSSEPSEADTGRRPPARPWSTRRGPRPRQVASGPAQPAWPDRPAWCSWLPRRSPSRWSPPPKSHYRPPGAAP
jgi:hypothetical protein